jgi:hypothetical protein
MSDKYYEIASRYNGIRWQHFEDDPIYASEYHRTRGCSSNREQRYCPYDKLELQLNPTPLDAVVFGMEPGCFGCLSSPVVTVLRADARQIFEPFLPRAVWGDVRRRVAGKLVHAGFYTCLLPRDEWVNIDRGHNYLPKKLCPVCGQVNWLSAQARHCGILRREARDKPVIMSENLFLCVTPEFYEQQELEKRLPDIKIVYKIKVYDEDPAGWVLPGDPGWNGVLVQRTEPEKKPRQSKKKASKPESIESP